MFQIRGGASSFVSTLQRQPHMKIRLNIDAVQVCRFYQGRYLFFKRIRLAKDYDHNFEDFFTHSKPNWVSELVFLK